MRLFAKKPQSNPQETIAKLRLTLEMLEKRQRLLQEKADREEGDAKKFVAQKKKREALLCLKKKKNYQREVDNLQGSYDTLSTQIFALENAKLNMEVLNAMKEGASSLQVLQNNMTVEKVDDVIDEIQNQMDIHKEISNAIVQPIGQSYDDEADLLEELANLEQEALDAQFMSVSSPPLKEPTVTTQVKFPEVSQQRPQASKEDDEIRALTESLAM